MCQPLSSDLWAPRPALGSSLENKEALGANGSNSEANFQHLISGRLWHSWAQLSFPPGFVSPTSGLTDLIVVYLSPLSSQALREAWAPVQGAVSLLRLRLILGCPPAIFNSRDTAGALLTKPQGTPFERKQTVLLQYW